MARVTIERCLKHFANRFDLVLAASRRARQLQGGGVPLVPAEDDKETVVALREIEAGRIGPDILHQDLAGDEDLDQEIRKLIEEAPEPVTAFAAPAEQEDEEEGEEEEEARTAAAEETAEDEKTPADEKTGPGRLEDTDSGSGK